MLHSRHILACYDVYGLLTKKSFCFIAKINTWEWRVIELAFDCLAWRDGKVTTNLSFVLSLRRELADTFSAFQLFNTQYSSCQQGLMESYNCSRQPLLYKSASSLCNRFQERRSQPVVLLNCLIQLELVSWLREYNSRVSRAESSENESVTEYSEKRTRVWRR